MSIISQFHSVETFNPASSKPMENQRLVILHYKARTVKDAAGNSKQLPKFPSLCVSIPHLRLTVGNLGDVNNASISAIQSATVALWESIQDSLIRSLIDQRRNRDNPTTSGRLNVSDDEISLASCAAFAASTGNGKLSGDAIAQWFDNVLTEPLMLALVTSDNSRTDEQIAAILANYKSAMTKLAAVQPGLPQPAQQQLRKAIAHAPESDVMADRLITKLDSMNKSAELILDAL